MKIFITTNLEKIFLTFLFLITVLPRFWGLGYSEFYGDETKTIYWNKAVPATQFLLSQRKGPVQFAVVWVMEKITGGWSEFAVRLPFAAAGSLSVFVLYFVVKKWFGWQAAFISAFLFSVNGIFIAFSRTAQYQSFLWLFGLLAILCIQHKKLFLAGGLLGLAFLSHYDAIFFAFPVLYLLLPLIRKDFKALVRFALPLVLCVGSFYVPYFAGNYFNQYTAGYLQRRMGQEEVAISSLYTYVVYNPYVISLPILVLGLLFFVLPTKRDQRVLFGLWLGLPFVVFEFLFRSPGTHIQQYVIPLIIMTGYVGSEALEYSKKWAVRDINSLIFIVLGIGYVYYSFITFIPVLNRGYPWNDEGLGQLNQSLYMYGFPYYKGWKQVGQHLRAIRAKDFYTNDNVVAASYYARGTPSNDRKPEYYVDVRQNQLFKGLEPWIFGRYQYVWEKTIEVEGRETITIYRRAELTKVEPDPTVL